MTAGREVVVVEVGVRKPVGSGAWDFLSSPGVRVLCCFPEGIDGVSSQVGVVRIVGRSGGGDWVEAAGSGGSVGEDFPVAGGARVQWVPGHVIRSVVAGRVGVGVVFVIVRYFVIVARVGLGGRTPGGQWSYITLHLMSRNSAVIDIGLSCLRMYGVAFVCAHPP